MICCPFCLIVSYFYPRSPCGERQVRYSDGRNLENFYPRSPCGERRLCNVRQGNLIYNFYPRSPCGERRCTQRKQETQSTISIHALLAESDARECARGPLRGISIHALLAESDLTPKTTPPKPQNFYPRSPCGERP